MTFFTTVVRRTLNALLGATLGLVCTGMLNVHAQTLPAVMNYVGSPKTASITATGAAPNATPSIARGGSPNVATPAASASDVITYLGGHHGPTSRPAQAAAPDAASAPEPIIVYTGRAGPSAPLPPPIKTMGTVPAAGAPSGSIPAMPTSASSAQVTVPNTPAAVLTTMPTTTSTVPPLPTTVVAAPSLTWPSASVAVGTGPFGAAVSRFQGTPVDEVEEKWGGLMQDEANHLTQEVNVPMSVVVVRTRDEVVRRFIAETLLHESTTRFSDSDSGLSALFSMGSRVNGQDKPTCYILFSRDKMGALQDQFLKPLSAKVGEQAAVAFVIGHEAGHCLDYYERQRTFPTRGYWTGDQTKTLGIAPAAFRRIFPTGMSPDAYQQSPVALYHDLAQRQYEERIADVFGLMWAANRGFPERLFDDVIDVRKYAARDEDHATLPALIGLRERYHALPDHDVAHLWALARQVQVEAGVNREAELDRASTAPRAGVTTFVDGGAPTPDDPTKGPAATVVGPLAIHPLGFGQRSDARTTTVMVVKDPKAIVVAPSKQQPKAFGEQGSFDQLKSFGSGKVFGNDKVFGQ